MSLVERLTEPPSNTRNQYCTVGIVLDELSARDGQGPGTEWAALAGALSTPGWSAVDISRALEAEGHTVSVRHIREHRLGHPPAACRAHKIGVTRPKNQGDF